MAFKVLLTLAVVVCIAVAYDLDTGMWVAHCARNATIHGVPAAGVPSHSPAFVTRFVRNITFPLGLAVIHASIINPNWYGVPDVQIKASQLSNDSAKVAKFDYDLYWPKFEVEGQYTAEMEGLIHSYHEGNWSVLLSEVHWSGEMDFNKEKLHIDKLKIHWKVDDVKTSITGGGIQGDTLAATIKYSLQTAFKMRSADLGTEVVLGYRLNEVWLKNATKVEALLDWCRHQEK
ncbi:unnamed protein product [Acanthoscelides obtectus]|uniref:Uncharacterized protein n=2 Tax=Acanthoscelides obtectus TaxID=200917 RepID=A0A9P0PHC5_ACAOB|nr:unnamed protein product [Acanthoscelides obtectus]CAK1624725.1 hypothetical protein AOBTE_LOCUS2726 [Acanthoscelides obtectus]